MKKIISWNVASLRARMDCVVDLIDHEKPDVLFLQEVKMEDHAFPYETFGDLDYDAYVFGQKAWNGVAILCKDPAQITHKGIPGLADDQARFIEVKMGDLSLMTAYVPNGTAPANNPDDTSRLEYKLAWFDALKKHLASMMARQEKFILGGDFNVIEKPTDVYKPELFVDSALMLPVVQEKFKDVQSIGLVNTVRQFHAQEHLYSFWDFQGGAWPRNNGILLDAIFVPDYMKSSVKDAEILKSYRGIDKPSDHAPVMCVLDLKE